MSETIEVSNMWVGHKPYILIEVNVPDIDDPDNITADDVAAMGFSIATGGGMEREQLGLILGIVVESLPDEYQDHPELDDLDEDYDYGDDD